MHAAATVVLSRIAVKSCYDLMYLWLLCSWYAGRRKKICVCPAAVSTNRLMRKQKTCIAFLCGLWLLLAFLCPTRVSWTFAPTLLHCVQPALAKTSYSFRICFYAPPPPFLYPLAKCTDIVDMCCSQSAVRQSRFSLHRSHAHTPNLSQVFVCYKSLPLDLFPCCSSYLFSLASSDWYRSVRQTQWTQPANRWRGP